MITPIVLLALGLLLVFVEFFLPGGVLGIAGGVMVVLSIVLAFVNAKTLTPALIFLGVAIVLSWLLIKFALWRIRRGKGGSLYLHSDQEGYSASEFAGECIGKEGIALSDLKPAGHILVEGKRVQALSKTGYLEKGSEVIIIGGQGAHLIVKRKEEN